MDILCIYYFIIQSSTTVKRMFRTDAIDFWIIKTGFLYGKQRGSTAVIMCIFKNIASLRIM